MKRIFPQIGFYLIAVIVGFLIVEIGYRGYLLLKDPRMHLWSETVAELPPIPVYSRSMWRFDAAEGFQYAKEQIFETHIANGRIVGCQVALPINKYGSPGLAEGNYEEADIKVALFGDSFSVFVDANNMTWANYFQRALQNQVGRSVHVLNQARDGIGLLQMFDIAALEVPRLKPDLAIIAFATPNMLMPRIWRIEKVIDGELRVITTSEPTETPDLGKSYETFILHPEAQGQWCDEHKNGGALDSVGWEIIDKYLRFRPRRHFAFTPWHSFLWHWIMHGDAFYSDADPRLRPITSPDVVAKDSRLITTIRVLNESDVPYILVHLPFYPELKTGKEYSIPLAVQIGQEISQLAGRPIHELLDYIPIPVADPERMYHSVKDIHPSTWGMQMYADAVSKAVLKNHFRH